MPARLVLSLISFFILVSNNSVIAQTRYVTDELEVTLRTGPSVQNKIVRVLSSGDRVDVIGEAADGDYSQVTTSGGDSGYILTRYLIANESARNRVIKLEAQLETLRSKPGELQTLLANSQEENQELIRQNVSLTEQLKSTTSELAHIKKVSKEAVSLSERNSKLENDAQQMLLQLDDMRIQNKVLKDQSAKRWFVLGGGTILVGLILGWILSISKRPRRQSSWGT